MRKFILFNGLLLFSISAFGVIGIIVHWGPDRIRGLAQPVEVLTSSSTSDEIKASEIYLNKREVELNAFYNKKFQNILLLIVLVFFVGLGQIMVWTFLSIFGHDSSQDDQSTKAPNSK